LEKCGMREEGGGRQVKVEGPEGEDPINRVGGVEKNNSTRSVKEDSVRP